jgi:membrane protein YqaA with SNARE-associated domain
MGAKLAELFREGDEERERKKASQDPLDNYHCFTLFLSKLPCVPKG